MVISVVTRKTAITDEAQWRERLQRALPRVKAVLERQPGFVSVQYMWGMNGGGEMGCILAWRTAEDYRNYVHSGAAATVSTIEDAALPTAAYPNGTWWRKSYVVWEE